MVLSAFSRAFSQLPDPAFRSVLLRGLAMTLVLFIALYAIADYGVGYIEVADNGWFLNALARVAAMGTFLVILLLLFPAIASFFIAWFLDDIAEAVERRYYPADPPGRSSPLGPSLAVAFRFTVILIVLNVLLLVFLIFPPIYPLVYYVVNGYLLSREYFELVSLRHNDPKTIRALRRSGSTRLVTAGIGIALLMTIPLVNLVAPLVATAVMVHLFKATQARSAV